MEKNFKKGFTIIEGLVAVFVITVAALIAYGSSQQVISYSRQAGDKFIAAYLAKEGIELARNVRDSNWVGVGNWNDGLTGCSAGCEADRNNSPVFSTWSGTGNFLNLVGGYYDYSAGTATKFKRKISIDDMGTADQLRISSLVSWKEGAVDKSITAEEILYKWR
jgi:prepilin-type N-terminal cleavage/methylation domain-containing protein